MAPKPTMNASDSCQLKLQYLRGRKDFFAGTTMTTPYRWLSTCTTSALLPMLFGPKGQLLWHIPTTRCEEERNPNTFRPNTTGGSSSSSNNGSLNPSYSNSFSPLQQRQQQQQQQQYAQQQYPPLDFRTHTDEEYLEAMRRNQKPCFSCMLVSTFTCGGFAAFFFKLALDIPKNLLAEDPKLRWSLTRVIWTQRFAYATSAVWVGCAVMTVLTY